MYKVLFFMNIAMGRKYIIWIFTYILLSFTGAFHEKWLCYFNNTFNNTFKYRIIVQAKVVLQVENANGNSN